MIEGGEMSHYKNACPFKVKVRKISSYETKPFLHTKTT